MTKRFVKWVSSEGRKVTFLSLSKQSGVNEKVIRQIFQKAEEGVGHSARPEMLGIELIKIGGSLYPALIDISKGTVIDVFSSVAVLSDRFGLDLLGENATLPAHVVVCDIDLLDLLRGFFSPVSELLISRSSLHRAALAAIEAHVVDFLKQLPKNKRQSTAPDLALFRKPNIGLGRLSHRRLSHWERYSPPLFKAYLLKERFLELWTSSRNPPESGWDLWKEQASDAGLDLGPLIELIDSRRGAIDDYIRHPALRYSYPTILRAAQNIDKATTHSFSASRAILLASQNKK
ncbi:transposase [Bradyrhizobium sp. BR 1432]|uniref:transposase n=1 Tax=Bradyrhizobium sp. BR 1432 TaxID=3447966 RepID=UPI003EE78A58